MKVSNNTIRRQKKILQGRLIFFLTLAFSTLSVTLHSEPLRFADLQRLAIEHNPAIRAMEQEVLMMKSRIPQAGSLDDPRLKLGVNNLPSDSFSFKDEDMTSKEIGVSQMIPLWGKLSSKERIAEGEYNKAVERLRRERIEVLNMLRTSIYELQGIRSTIQVLNEIKDRLKLVIDSEIAANKAGMGSLSNVIKANVEYTMIDEEVIALTQKKEEARQNIIYLVGEEVELGFDELPEPDFRDLQPKSIKGEVYADNPDLKIARLDREIANEEISLKTKEYYPDVEFGISYMQRDAGPEGKRSDMINGMATINVPFWFWKKNVHMVNEMQKKSEAAGNFLINKSNELNSKAETLVYQTTKWRDLYRLYHDRLIPQVTVALETNLAQYKTGAVEFMPVIDTIRQLLQYKKDLIMVTAEYYKSYSELSAIQGMEIVP